MTKAKPQDQLQKRGRKSLFREEYILIAKAAARFGAIEEEIADELNIGITTLERWKKKFPKFRGALNVGKQAADDRVERALCQRALGYSHPAVKILTVANGDNEGSRVEIVPYTEHYPPDTTAGIFWLKNRRPDLWRDVHNIEAEMGHYVISEKPMSESDWIEQFAKPKTIDLVPASPELPRIEETADIVRTQKSGASKHRNDTNDLETKPR
jgi:hypothetical protein